MTAFAWNWILAIIGTVASVAGVVFSCMAWVQAKGAMRAAEMAAHAARARDTTHEFTKLAADAKELLTAVQERRLDRAVEAANDLAHSLTVAISRRTSYLPEDVELENTVKHLQAVSAYLSSKGFPEDLQEIAKLTRRCQQVHQDMCEVQGVLERSVEGVEQ
jgi:hypothetical protein